jgi:hypothetical protein
VKGDWIYDEQADVWHLSMGIAARSDGDPLIYVTWCHKELERPKTRKGGELDWSMTLHDECVRQSERVP